MSNILITGTNGFLGGATYEFLSDKYKVFPLHSKYIHNFWRLKDNIKKGNFDTIINFGWGGGSDSKYLDSIEQFDNIKTCIDLFNFGLEVGVKRFIQVSSSWEYFYKFGHNNYGWCKYLVHKILNRMARTSNIKIEHIVPWWIYGPNDKENRFIPKIINSCLKNELISLHPAQNFVDYLFIEDFVSAVDLIIEKEGYMFESYNLCSGKRYKIQDIVEKIKSLTNSKSVITYDKEYPSNFNMEWIGHSGTLKNMGWGEKFTLEEGLKKTIEFYEKRNN